MKFLQFIMDFRFTLMVGSLILFGGLLGSLIFSALVNRMWIWHLSWIFIPIIAIIVMLLYDTKYMDSLEPAKLKLRKRNIWNELSESRVNVIRTVDYPFRRV